MSVIAFMKTNIVNCGLAASFLLIVQISCKADSSWPDSPEKQKMMEHCGELLLSSFDTNQIDLIRSKIATNQPAIIRLGNQVVTLVTNENAVLQLKDFSNRVSLNLKKVAVQLTASNLNTYLSKLGYCASASNPHGSTSAFFNLWSRNGPVKYFNIRSDTGAIIMSASFYENGRLKDFRENISNDEEFIFNADGRINGYSWIIKDKIEVDVSFDNEGNVKIRGFILDK